MTLPATPLLLALTAPPAFDLHPAAVLDPAAFSYAAPVQARPSAEGVSRLRLSPALLAVADDELADLRVIDAQSQQWPFVPVPDAGREPMDLAVVPLAKGTPPEHGRSRFQLLPPVAPVTLEGLVLRIDRESFRRGYRIDRALPDGGGMMRYEEGFLERAPGSKAEVAVPLPPVQVRALVLIVDDGDEAPLPIVSARAEAKVAELRLVAPAGAYTLLAGNPEAHAPRYELGETAEARARVLGAPAGDAEVGAPAPNPRHKRPGGAAAGWEKEALWGVLGLAVVALGALTLRLSRKEQPPAAR